jgi:hypothetical protein
MGTIAVRKVKELDESARRWVENLLGRELNAEEEITVLAFPPHPAPSAAAREESIRRLDAVLAKSAANLQDIPDSEFESAVDEAMENVRRWNR